MIPPFELYLLSRMRNDAVVASVLRAHDIRPSALPRAREAAFAAGMESHFTNPRTLAALAIDCSRATAGRLDVPLAVWPDFLFRFDYSSDWVVPIGFVRAHPRPFPAQLVPWQVTIDDFAAFASFTCTDEWYPQLDAACTLADGTMVELSFDFRLLQATHSASAPSTA